MSSRGQAHLYSTINRQMQRVTQDHQRRLRQAWIDRVLGILDSDNLIAKAAASKTVEGGLVFDCNIAPLVWDDPRIAYRVQQLKNSNVDVALVDYKHTVAGKTFSRARIQVDF